MSTAPLRDVKGEKARTWQISGRSSFPTLPISYFPAWLSCLSLHERQTFQM
jgi:hypothetical protein